MIRVASRQRLFSWDHFDASAQQEHNHDDDDNFYGMTSSDHHHQQQHQDEEGSTTAIHVSNSLDDDLSDYRTCISMSRPTSMIFHPSYSFGLGMDHIVSQDEGEEIMEHGPLLLEEYQGSTKTVFDMQQEHLVPKSIKTTQQHATAKKTTTLATKTSLLNLNQDVQYSIMSYLNLNELKALTLTCRYLNQLLLHDKNNNTKNEISSNIHSSSRNAIWWKLIQRTWPSLPLKEKEQSADAVHDEESPSLYPPEAVNFVIQEETPCLSNQLTASNSATITENTIRINYAAILSQAALLPPPTSIDDFFFKPTTITEIETVRVLNEEAMIIRRRHRSRRKKIIYRMYDLNVKLDDLKPFLRSNLGNHFCNQGGEEAGVFDNGNERENCDIEVVQYVGKVGVGDRSVRSNQPFPRPLKSLPTFKRGSSAVSSSLTFNQNEIEESSNGSYFNLSSRGRKRSLPHNERSTILSSSSQTAEENNTFASPMNFLDRLRSCSKNGSIASAVIEKQAHHSRLLFRAISSPCKTSYPFVSPTITNSKQCCDPYMNHDLKFRRVMEIDLTPRSIAYFEVSILPRDKSQEVDINNDSNEDDISRPNTVNFMNHFQQVVNNDNESESSTSCVAVGISTKDYKPSVRMPGWDPHSFAYHSDDGGIFHSKGEMIRVYGPRYDVGDTVGCGVNYQNGGIFFTLNGDFLGYAWCDEKVVSECKEDLYPTVGVDSSNPLALNFGNKRPFIWDFPKFLANWTSP